jgi:DNA-directed RNA polymerase specialized sigma24 family protein
MLPDRVFFPDGRALTRQNIRNGLAEGTAAGIIGVYETAVMARLARARLALRNLPAAENQRRLRA